MNNLDDVQDGIKELERTANLGFAGGMITEYPPEDMEAFQRMRREHRGCLRGFAEIFSSIAEMPATMKQLAVVQFFTWFALPCMWQFFGLAVARQLRRA